MQAKPENGIVACPVCEHEDSILVCRRPETVIHQNLLYATAAAARAAERGTVDLQACRRCGFVFNAAFDPNRVEYGPNYENCQEHSTNFVNHVESLISRLVKTHEVTSGRVVEIGCGAGAFLTRFLSREGNHCTGLGFDPAYRGPSEKLDGRLKFVPTLYGEGVEADADVVICRHVIEHIPQPVEFLRTLRRALGPSSRAKVFVETPCAEWILEQRVLWDVFYEHCSLFTASSLKLAMARAGLETTAVRRVFGGQYLWAEAVAAEESEPIPEQPRTVRLARMFSENETVRVGRWRELLDEWRSRGEIVAWGAGAKGVTFCNLADPHGERLQGVVDVNPAKQGRFVAGTGHPILAPQQAGHAAAAVVLNPNYTEEIRAMLRSIGASTSLLDFMSSENAAVA